MICIRTFAEHQNQHPCDAKELNRTMHETALTNFQFVNG